MAIGISALTCRLDADVPAADGGVDWADLIAFLGDLRPAFAGKYLIGSPWQWVHGEATSLIDPSVPGAKLRLAPIAASDPVRQSQGGELGKQWGDEDGTALAEAIKAALNVGDLAFPSDSRAIYAYLEVKEHTDLTPEYWSSWATAVERHLYVGDRVGGQIPFMIQGFLPCIATRFVAGASPGNWEVPASIRAALDTAVPDLVLGNTRCHGFWALTDEPATIVAMPVPTFPSFTAYDQQQHTGQVAVPVRLWRYATGESASPIHEVGRVTLDMTLSPAGQPDATFDGMLIVRPWSAKERPSQIGVDRGSPVAGINQNCRQDKRAGVKNQICCLLREELKVFKLPEIEADGSDRLKISPPLQEKVSFVARYISDGPRDEDTPPVKHLKDKDMLLQEAKFLSEAGVDIISLFQTRYAKFKQVPDYLSNKGIFKEKEKYLSQYLSNKFKDRNNGVVDGYSAAWYAAHVLRQPPHTPIYFCVDCSVTSTGICPYKNTVISTTVLVDYFRSIKLGIQDYLKDAKPEFRVPYSVGAYACSNACDTLYRNGLASHFFQVFPIMWGDEEERQYSNLTAFKHANIWQVATDYKESAMVSSGLLKCSGLVYWRFAHTRAFNSPESPSSASAPRTINIQVANQSPELLSYPATEKEVLDATRATSVSIDDQINSMTNQPTRVYVLAFSTDPITIKVIYPDTDSDPNFSSIDPHLYKLGSHDLDVAWGNPGGWRVRG